ncbi:hypothetical protein [Thermocrispum agreste]|jgi:hypothetical protein|uniref:hypothetical protein n=1 Tax=Thermocrispum agreste TaxID=37925 RepID=UPI00316AD343
MDLVGLADQLVELGGVVRLDLALPVVGGGQDDFELAALLQDDAGEHLIRATREAAHPDQRGGIVLGQLGTDLVSDQRNGWGGEVGMAGDPIRNGVGSFLPTNQVRPDPGCAEKP